MRSFLAILILTLPLYGCFTDQTKQVAICQLDAQKTYLHESESDDPRNVIASIGDINGATVTCMQANGYLYMNGVPGSDRRCPVFKNDTRFVNATNAYCYRPAGWGAHQIYNFEMLLGR